MSEPTEMDAVVARVERIVAIAERQVGCIPEMFHLADADDGRLLQECSAEYPHQCFDEPGHHALTLADLRALLAQLEAAKRDSARLDAFDVWRIRADIVPYLTPTSRSVSFIDVKHGGVRLMGNGASIREALDNLASHPPTGAPENG